MWSGPNATSSNTVGLNSWSSGSWNTSPTSRRTSRIVGLPTARPATRTSPWLGTSVPLSWSIERALAGAVRAHERDLLAVLDPQVDAAQRLEPVGVAEVDVGELHRPAPGQRLRAVALVVVDVRVRVRRRAPVGVLVRVAVRVPVRLLVRA